MIIFVKQIKDVLNHEEKPEKQSASAGIPEINIGLVGHVDHGKTTLTQALTGRWTDTHSEEIKRGITIRLGYANSSFYFCSKCNKYSLNRKCFGCESICPAKRTVSFVDAPGHETLMATVLSGASLMDGALLIIAANEHCPQPQTSEHLKALDIVGIKKIVIVQTKVELVSKEQALKNYREIKEFVNGTIAENAPIIPVSAVHGVNIDALIQSIEDNIPTPERDMGSFPKFFIARSFDINSPGTPVQDLKGGVIGGSLTKGKIDINAEIEIRPGIKTEGKWTPLRTKVYDIVQAGHTEQARPGGLVAIQTGLDPSLTKSDALSGNILGLPGKLPPVHENLRIKVKLFDHAIGLESPEKKTIKTGDALMLTVAIAKTVGVVASSAGDVVDINLKLPVCADKGDRVAISAQVSGRWHLIGWGELV